MMINRSRLLGNPLEKAVDPNRFLGPMGAFLGGERLLGSWVGFIKASRVTPRSDLVVPRIMRSVQ
jgi:hypothetical protein